MINEARLISSIITSKDIAPVLNSAQVDLLFGSCADVWSFVKEYYYQNKAIVPIEIVEEKFPDFKYVETNGTVKHYLDQLRDEYQTTMLQRIALGLANDIGTKPNKELISALYRYASDLTKATSGIKDLDITDSKKSIEHYSDIKKRMEENGGVLGIRTGFDSIDASYPTGLAPGQFIMIMSRTNQGKSWFALDLAINAWAQGKRVLYVSLEMSPAQVRDRAYTFMSRGQFNMSDLSRAQIDIDELDSWTTANLNGDESFVVTSSDGMGDFTPGQLQGKIDQYRPDIVFVDYLQLMSDNRNSTGETERIRNVSKESKAASMSNDIPIVAVVSASSNDTKEYNKPPEIYEMAGSRQAPYDADLVLSLFSTRQNDNTLITEIVARKNRNGPLFDFVVKLDIEGGKISENWDDAPSLLD